jgi:hypothetical protein
MKGNVMKKILLVPLFLLIVGTMVFAKESANAVVTELESAVTAFENLVNKIVKANKITDIDREKLMDLEARLNQVKARADNKNLLDDWTEAHLKRVNNALTRMEHVYVKFNGWDRNRN